MVTQTQPEPLHYKTFGTSISKAGYDIWTNFAYRGDDNPTHNHGGLISGVIYYQNHNHPVHFDEYNCSYKGENGTMIMFPSQVLHHVKEQTSSKERITLAFNINQRDAV